MKKKINLKKWTCINCWFENNKSDYIKKIVQWNWVYVCRQCWYYNSVWIFTDYKEIKVEVPIFWESENVKKEKLRLEKLKEKQKKRFKK